MIPKITSFLIVLAFISVNDLEKVKEKAEEYLNQNLNDPSSYEFVSLEHVHDITQEDNLNYRIDYFTDRNESIAEDLKKLKNDLGEDVTKVACKAYEFNFRAKNEYGALILNKTRLFVSNEYEVRRIAYKEAQWLNSCNELEEYREIVLKHIG